MPGENDYKDILSKIMCSTENHNCESCPGKVAIQNYLSDLFTSHDFDDVIVYKQWVHTDRTTLVSLSTSIQEFTQIACDAFYDLHQCHFIAKAQSRALKEDLAPDEAIVLLKTTASLSKMLFNAKPGIQSHCWNNKKKICLC